MFSILRVFSHILTWCFLPLNGELLHILTFIFGHYIAKQHSQSSDINGKREKLPDSSWAGSGRLPAMERIPLYRQHWQGLCHIELQLGLCKSLAVLTKRDTQIQVLSLFLLLLKARSAAALADRELSPSCAFRRATSHQGLSQVSTVSCQAPGDFPGKRGGQGWPSGIADFPIPSSQEEQSGRATVSPLTLHLKAPLKREILLLTPRAHLCKALGVQGGVWGCLSSCRSLGKGKCSHPLRDKPTERSN